MKTIITYDDGLELIDSGTFINFKQEKSVSLSIYEEDGTRLSIKIEFIYDKSVKESSFDFSQQDIYTLLLKVTHNGIIANYGYIKQLLLVLIMVTNFF